MNDFLNWFAAQKLLFYPVVYGGAAAVVYVLYLARVGYRHLKDEEKRLEKERERRHQEWRELNGRD